MSLKKEKNQLSSLVNDGKKKKKNALDEALNI